MWDRQLKEYGTDNLRVWDRQFRLLDVWVILEKRLFLGLGMFYWRQTHITQVVLRCLLRWKIWVVARSVCCFVHWEEVFSLTTVNLVENVRRT